MAAPLLEIRNVKKYYPVKKVRNGEDISVKAVDQIDLTVNQGEIVGLVGESGCGKSTLGKTILKLHDITGGQILFHGEDITNYTEKQMRPLREKIQIIFQDPYASLNPKKKVVQSVMTPLDVSGKYTKEEKLKKVIDILNEVGLSEKFLEKYPHEMSGGQRQRVVIARALINDPELVICDEPVSGCFRPFPGAEPAEGLTEGAEPYLYFYFTRSECGRISVRPGSCHVSGKDHGACREKAALWKSTPPLYTSSPLRDPGPGYSCKKG